MKPPHHRSINRRPTRWTSFADHLVRIGVMIAIAIVSVEASAEAADKMTFAIAADPAERFGEVATQGVLNIYASGPIAGGDTERLLAFVRAHQLEGAQVVFDSPGGSLLEGVKMGRAIRSLRFTTTIGAEHKLGAPRPKAICASACAYAFAGGVWRTFSDGDALGIHQFHSEGGEGVSEGGAQIISGYLVAYLDEMGIDAKAFSVASASRPDEIIWLSQNDAKALRFVFDGVRPTTAEVRIANMRPYLRLDQEKAGVELRVLVLCWDKSLVLQAGIVTNPQEASNMAGRDWLKRSYLEFDGRETLQVDGTTGAKVEDSTVWLERALTKQQAAMLLNSRELGIWLDGFGMVRAGGVMDLGVVHEPMRDYFAQCYGS